MKILVIGKLGMLAQELQRAFQGTECDVVCRGRPDVDLVNHDSIREVLKLVQPTLIINAAASTGVDQAESEPDQAFAINRDGVQCLAEQACRLDLPLVHLSTDYVFAGGSPRPYREDDVVSPLGVYGQSKWEGEEVVRSAHPHHIILRTAWVYSMYGRNFLKTIVERAQKGQALRIVDDQRGCPTWAKDLASALVVITQRIRKGKDVPWGTYHLCGAGETTWYEFAQAILMEAQGFSSLQAKGVIPIATKDYHTLAKRPAYSVLNCSKIDQAFGIKPQQWQDSMPQCVKELFACPNLLHGRS